MAPASRITGIYVKIQPLNSDEAEPKCSLELQLLEGPQYFAIIDGLGNNGYVHEKSRRPSSNASL